MHHRVTRVATVAVIAILASFGWTGPAGASTSTSVSYDLVSSQPLPSNATPDDADISATAFAGTPPAGYVPHIQRQATPRGYILRSPGYPRQNGYVYDSDKVVVTLVQCVYSGGAPDCTQLGEMWVQLHEYIYGGPSTYWALTFNAKSISGMSFSLSYNYECGVNIKGHTDSTCKTYPSPGADGPAQGLFNPGTTFAESFGSTTGITVFPMVDMQVQWANGHTAIGDDGTAGEKFRGWDVCTGKKTSKLCAKSGNGHVETLPGSSDLGVPDANASTYSLSAAGGGVTVSASAANATSFTFIASPALAGLPTTVPAASNGTAAQVIQVPANRTSDPLNYVVTVEAYDSNNGQYGLESLYIEQSSMASPVLFVNKNGAGTNMYAGYGGPPGLGGINVLGQFQGAFDPSVTKFVTGDFNGDGFQDIFFINKNGAGINAYVSYGDSTGYGQLQVVPGLAGAFDPAATLITSGDYNADGVSDVFFDSKNGAGINAYVLSGVKGQLIGQVSGLQVVPGLAGAFDPAATLITSGDYNADGVSDVFFDSKNGAGINAYVLSGVKGQLIGQVSGLQVVPGYSNAFDPASTKLQMT